MSKYYAYIRVSTDKQTLENQKHKILEFAFNKKIQIEDFIEVEVSSRKNQKERLIEDLFLKLKENDTLVVTELSRLGRNMLEILNLIEKFNSKNIKLIFINQPELSTDNSALSNLLISIYGYFAQTEREIISERTKQGLAVARAKGKVLGRQKGQIVKSMYDEHKEKIEELLSLNLKEDNDICKIKTKDNDNLIVSYTPKRAKKDEYNRTKGLKRLEKKVKSGKLTKDQINSRGYNKYLHLKNEISVEIDYEKFYQDSYWDGLKGYITNTNLSNDAVISNYSNLWQIEKAFRMSKSDLEIRPIYHFTRRRIEAHISISFVAYSIYKELERLLYLYNAPFSVKKAREIIHNIYQIEVTLPDSGVKQKVLLQMDEEQQFLVNMIQNEISKSFG